MPTLPSILIWGAGGHAKVVADILRAQNQFVIAGFLDDTNPARHNADFSGARIFAAPNSLDVLITQGLRHGIIAIGNNAARLRLAQDARAKGFTLATVIHPSATISPTATIAAGTVIGPHAVINAAARIGESVIVNTAAIVEHDCIIEDGVHLSPRVAMGGGVTIGRGTWIGIGAVIRDHLTIGANSMIGTGAAVVQNLPDNIIAYGVPAKIKTQKAPEPTI